LLYSCNNNSTNQFMIEQYPGLLDSLASYLEDILKNIPYLKKVMIVEEGKDSAKPLSVIDNNNYPVADLVNQEKKVIPSEIFQKLSDKMITNRYQIVSEVTLLENVRMIIHIIRNLVFTKANEIMICKHTKVFKLLQNFFTEAPDQEIARDCLDIFANLCRNIQLKQLSNMDRFCQKIYSFLESENQEEIEAALDCMRHLVITQENEPILESHIKLYADTIIDLLIHANVDIREIVLEFLCFLSDLKMNTRVAIAKHPKSVLRLVGLLVSGSGKNGDKITKLSALILSNLSMAPAAKTFFLPYERDLFVVAASDESVSKIVCNILSEMDNINPQTGLDFMD